MATLFRARAIAFLDRFHTEVVCTRQPFVMSALLANPTTVHTFIRLFNVYYFWKLFPQLILVYHIFMTIIFNYYSIQYYKFTYLLQSINQIVNSIV